MLIYLQGGIMKILFINCVCGIGSTGKICTDLARAYEADGHEVRIAYGREQYVPQNAQRFGIQIGCNWEVQLHAIQTRIFDEHGLGSIVGTKKFVKWIKEYNPDIIHLHVIHGYYINIKILFEYLKICQKPIVWTMHDCWAFTGHCTYFDFVGCEKWKKQCGNCPQKHAYPASQLMDASKKNWMLKRKIFTDVPNMIIVTPSEWLKKLLLQTFFEQYSITVINNGIDTDIFRPSYTKIRQQYKLEKKKIILGVSSKWPQSKRLDQMVKLANVLGEEYKVVVIGINKEQMKLLPPNMLGFQKTSNVKELVAWYTAADVFVNPTLEDNYPTVNLEAQACGTPVVTYDVGGSAECIKNNYGTAVKKNDFEALRDAVIRYANAKGTIPYPQIMGKNEFSERYMNLYKCLMFKQEDMEK